MITPLSIHDMTQRQNWISQARTTDVVQNVIRPPNFKQKLVAKRMANGRDRCAFAASLFSQSVGYESSCAHIAVPSKPFPPLQLRKYSAKTRDTIACSFITILSAGPEVSLKGSPTVSPVTAASCAGTFLPLSAASSETPLLMYFLQLSQAPPELDIEMASCTEETSEPVRMPNTACTPKKVPAIKGDPITSAPGAIISLSEALVEI